jgi:hypothetical protein
VTGIINGEIIFSSDRWNSANAFWKFDPNTGNITSYTNSTYYHNLPGVIYQDKIYWLDSVHSEVFYSNNNTWSLWQNPPTAPLVSGCLVASNNQVQIRILTEHYYAVSFMPSTTNKPIMLKAVLLNVVML